MNIDTNISTAFRVVDLFAVEQVAVLIIPGITKTKHHTDFRNF